MLELHEHQLQMKSVLSDVRPTFCKVEEFGVLPICLAWDFNSSPNNWQIGLLHPLNKWPNWWSKQFISWTIDYPFPHVSDYFEVAEDYCGFLWEELI